MCRCSAATDGSCRHRRYLVLSGSESNSGVVVRSCMFAPFYVARGATTRDSNVTILVESGTPPCQRTAGALCGLTWGRSTCLVGSESDAAAERTPSGWVGEGRDSRGACRRAEEQSRPTAEQSRPTAEAVYGDGGAVYSDSRRSFGGARGGTAPVVYSGGCGSRRRAASMRCAPGGDHRAVRGRGGPCRRRRARRPGGQRGSRRARTGGRWG